MAFTVEDGTGLANANSYVTVEFVDEYFNDRGSDLWDGTPERKQQAIVRATDYIEKRFGRKFRGWKQSRAQGLSWPRFNAVDNSGHLYSEEDNIPRKLKMAVAEYALRAILQGELAPDPGLPVDGQSFDSTITAPSQNLQTRISQTTEKVGPLSTTVTYQDKSAAGIPKSSLVDSSLIPEYPAADMLLEELIANTLSRKLTRG